MEKYTGRGLVVKRPGVLSKVQMLNLVLGVGVFSLLPIYPVQIWSLEMPQEPSSRPQPQISGPMGAGFLSSTGLGFGTLIERERERNSSQYRH